MTTAKPRVLDFTNSDQWSPEAIFKVLSHGRRLERPEDLDRPSFKIIKRPDGTLKVIEKEIPHERIVRAAELWAEMHKRPGFKPHHFFKHPELADINSIMLRRRVEEYLAKNPQPGRSGKSGDNDRPRVWNAKDLESAKPKSWLAKHRIPRSGVTVLVGDEGIGKSLFWVWIVAAVTTGDALPEYGIPEREPQHVRLVLTEDDWSTEVRPRLELSGADLDYVSVICEKKDGSGSPTFPSDDMDLLYERTADGATPVLVIVDAWLDTVPGGLNVQTPQDARLALHPWKDVAVQTSAAVLLMTHTNRAKGKARDKYGITGELRKKARMTLFAQTNDRKQLLIGPEKANGTAIVPSSVFSIDVVQVRPPTDDDDGTVARLEFVEDSDHTAGEIADSDGMSPEQMWLINQLAEGPQKNVIERAIAEGFKAYRIRLAAKELKVKFERVGFPAESQWSLP